MTFWPTNGTITSGYGNRSSPGGIGSTNHRGIDIAAPTGTPVIAPVDMTIISAGQAGGFGNLIQGKDANGNTYQFGHLSSIGVKAGDVVQAGFGIGNVGSTGKSTGPHLHFGIKDANGNYVNPASFLASATKAGKDAIASAKKLLGIGAKAAAITAGPVGIAAGAIGGGIFGGKSWLEQFRDWIASTSFFQRAAMVIIGVIFLVAAFGMLARGQVTSQIVKAIK